MAALSVFPGWTWGVITTANIVVYFICIYKIYLAINPVGKHNFNTERNLAVILNGHIFGLYMGDTV